MSPSSSTFVPPGFLDRDAFVAVGRNLDRRWRTPGFTSLDVTTGWLSHLQIIANRVLQTGELWDQHLGVWRQSKGNQIHVDSNRRDDDSLQQIVELAERALSYGGVLGDPNTQPFRITPLPHLNPTLWSDSTVSVSPRDREAMLHDALAAVQAAGLRAYAYLATSAHAWAAADSYGTTLYFPYTMAQYSVTVRSPDGTGSGWAGMDHQDWSRIDPAALTARATEKCLASRNPSAVEPGRYTLIMEPQAVCDLCSPMMYYLGREDAEQGSGPFAAGHGRTKIGERIVDPRITISADPMDPDLGTLPVAVGSYGNDPIPATTWIEQGVLRQLAYGRDYAIMKLHQNESRQTTYSFRMSDGPTSRDEMIATTTRGLLVTRFSGVNVIDKSSLMSSGYTRDGLWLIEHGKVTKPVKNFRFTESPLFALNNVEQIGPSVRAFNVEEEWRSWTTPCPVITPLLKVRDFNFSSLSDAV